MVKVDLQLLILVWIEVTAVFTLETTTQWTILWRPFIVPGLYYERLDTPPDQPDFMKGSKCLDMCEYAFFHGPRICRYLMIEPLQADWDKPITQTMDFVDRVRDMRVKNCYLFEAQKIEGDLAKKFFISKGFRNPFNNEQGTHITLEFVAEVYQSWLWPNPFADVVVPDHFEMDTRATKYFNKTGSCPWNSNMIPKDSDSTSTVADKTTTQMTTTTAEEVSTIIMYSMMCGDQAAHSFGVAKCPDTNAVPRIIYESEFAREKQSNCAMEPYLTVPTAHDESLLRESPALVLELFGIDIDICRLISAVNHLTRIEGWCSSIKTCGFDTPLYVMVHRSGNVQSDLVVSTTDAAGSILCYVKSSNKIGII